MNSEDTSSPSFHRRGNRPEAVYSRPSLATERLSEDEPTALGTSSTPQAAVWDQRRRVTWHHRPAWSCGNTTLQARPGGACREGPPAQNSLPLGGRNSCLLSKKIQPDHFAVKISHSSSGRITHQITILETSKSSISSWVTSSRCPDAGVAGYHGDQTNTERPLRTTLRGEGRTRNISPATRARLPTGALTADQVEPRP